MEFRCRISLSGRECTERNETDDCGDAKDGGVDAVRVADLVGTVANHVRGEVSVKDEGSETNYGFENRPILQATQVAHFVLDCAGA